MVFYSLTSTVTYIFYCVILVYKSSPLNKKQLKNLSEGKKDIAKNVHKAPYPGM